MMYLVFLVHKNILEVLILFLLILNPIVVGADRSAAMMLLKIFSIGFVCVFFEFADVFD